MAKLTASQVAVKIGVSVYTLKRWYKWYETEEKEKLDFLFKKGMPKLPAYETIGSTSWKYWDENDIPDLIEFKNYIPNTRRGFMGSLNKKKEDN